MWQVCALRLGGKVEDDEQLRQENYEKILQDRRTIES